MHARRLWKAAGEQHARDEPSYMSRSRSRASRRTPRCGAASRSARRCRGLAGRPRPLPKRRRRRSLRGRGAVRLVNALSFPIAASTFSLSSFLSGGLNLSTFSEIETLIRPHLSLKFKRLVRRSRTYANRSFAWGGLGRALGILLGNCGW